MFTIAFIIIAVLMYVLMILTPPIGLENNNTVVAYGKKVIHHQTEIHSKIGTFVSQSLKAMPLHYSALVVLCITGILIYGLYMLIHVSQKHVKTKEHKEAIIVVPLMLMVSIFALSLTIFTDVIHVGNYLFPSTALVLFLLPIHSYYYNGTLPKKGLFILYSIFTMGVATTHMVVGVIVVLSIGWLGILIKHRKEKIPLLYWVWCGAGLCGLMATTIEYINTRSSIISISDTFMTMEEKEHSIPVVLLYYIALYTALLLILNKILHGRIFHKWWKTGKTWRESVSNFITAIGTYQQLAIISVPLTCVIIGGNGLNMQTFPAVIFFSIYGQLFYQILVQYTLQKWIPRILIAIILALLIRIGILYPAFILESQSNARRENIQKENTESSIPRKK